MVDQPEDLGDDPYFETPRESRPFDSALVQRPLSELPVRDAIVLSPEQGHTKEKRFQGLPTILMRTIGLFVEDVAANDVGTARLYNDSIRYLAAVRENARTDHGLSEAELDNLFEPPGHPNPFAGKRTVNLHIVRPVDPLPTDGLEFDPAVMTGMMELGRQRARQVLGNVPPPVV